MSKTLYKRTDYSLANLIEGIDMGEIGLPDIQRPFVWEAAKVRDSGMNHGATIQLQFIFPLLYTKEGA